MTNNLIGVLFSFIALMLVVFSTISYQEKIKESEISEDVSRYKRVVKGLKSLFFIIVVTFLINLIYYLVY